MKNPAYSDTENLRSFTAQIYQLAVVENIYPLNAVAIKDSFVIGMYDWFSPFRDFSLLERYDRLNFFKSFDDLCQMHRRGRMRIQNHPRDCDDQHDKDHLSIFRKYGSAHGAINLFR